MPFTIPSSDLAAVPSRQSVWYETDIAILVRGQAGNGVLADCTCYSQDYNGTGPDNMTVYVEAGQVAFMDRVWEIPETVALPISPADPTLARIDIVMVGSTGEVTVSEGTPAAAPTPPTPAYVSNGVALAYVFVEAGVTAIINEMIVDKRMFLPPVVVGGGGGGGGGSTVAGWSAAAVEIFRAAFAGAGLVSGGGIWSQAQVSSGSNPDDMTVYVTGGMIRTSSLYTGGLSLLAEDLALPIEPADATLPRIDLVAVDFPGVAWVVPGVPAETPIPPALTEGGDSGMVVALRR